jgi:acyl-CoA thioester hydrolase
MVVEAHVRYLRELKLEDPVRATVQLLGYDAKRIHLVEELRHATGNWVSATSESMTLGVDMTAKKVAPFHDSVLRLLKRMQAAHAVLPRPDGAGRSVRMPDKR